MTKLKSLFVILASCLTLGGFAPDVSAQDRGWQDFGAGADVRRRDRDDDNRGDARRRDRDDNDRDRRARDRDDDDDDRDRRRARGRDRDDWDRRGRDWRGGYDRGRNCYVVRRRIVEPDGDVTIRSSRVCED